MNSFIGEVGRVYDIEAKSQVVVAAAAAMDAKHVEELAEDESELLSLGWTTTCDEYDASSSTSYHSRTAVSSPWSHQSLDSYSMDSWDSPPPFSSVTTSGSCVDSSRGGGNSASAVFNEGNFFFSELDDGDYPHFQLEEEDVVTTTTMISRPSPTGVIGHNPIHCKQQKLSILAGNTPLLIWWSMCELN